MSGAAQLVTSGPLILALPVAAAAGAVTFLSPCCLPLVPGYLSFVTGMAGASGSSPAPAAAQSGRRRRRERMAEGRRWRWPRRPPLPPFRRAAAPDPGRGRDGAVRAGVLGGLRRLRGGARRARPPADRARPPADADPGRPDHPARAAVRRGLRPVLLRGPDRAPVRAPEGGPGGRAAARSDVRARLDSLHRAHAHRRARPVGRPAAPRPGAPCSPLCTPSAWASRSCSCRSASSSRCGPSPSPGGEPA